MKFKKIYSALAISLLTFAPISNFIQSANIAYATDLIDTDGDGILDKDENSNEIDFWNFSDRDAVLFSNLAYYEDKFLENLLLGEKLTNLKADEQVMLEMAQHELSLHWSIYKTYHESNGFDAVLLQNKDVFVLAIRGTNDASDADDDAWLAIGTNPDQAVTVEKIIKNLSADKSIKNLYITGHSLGGYLTLRAHAYAQQQGYSFVKKSYTFNAPKVKGSWFNTTLNKTAELINSLVKNGAIKNYKTDNDNVVGTTVGFMPNSISVGSTKGKHSLSSFFEESVNEKGYFSIGERKDITGKYLETLVETTTQTTEATTPQTETSVTETTEKTEVSEETQETEIKEEQESTKQTEITTSESSELLETTQNSTSKVVEQPKDETSQSTTQQVVETSAQTTQKRDEDLNESIETEESVSEVEEIRPSSQPKDEVVPVSQSSVKGTANSLGRANYKQVVLPNIDVNAVALESSVLKTASETSTQETTSSSEKMSSQQESTQSVTNQVNNTSSIDGMYLLIGVVCIVLVGSIIIIIKKVK